MPQCEYPLQTLHAHSTHPQRVNTPIELIQLQLVQFKLQFLQQQRQFLELQLVR